MNNTLFESYLIKRGILFFLIYQHFGQESRDEFVSILPDPTLPHRCAKVIDWSAKFNIKG